MNTRGILELSPNGDPFGSGYHAIEYKDNAERDTGIGVYRGDIGDRPRSYWRWYARRAGYRLVEYRGYGQ